MTHFTMRNPSISKARILDFLIQLGPSGSGDISRALDQPIRVTCVDLRRLERAGQVVRIGQDGAAAIWYVPGTLPSESAPRTIVERAVSARTALERAWCQRTVDQSQTGCYS